MAEAILWVALKGRSMRGYDFHRQTPIGPYIVDFFCPRLMLAIEIDGESHRGKADYDHRRQAWLEGLGVRFLRLDDAYVRNSTQDAWHTIDGWIAAEEAREADERPPPPE